MTYDLMGEVIEVSFLNPKIKFVRVVLKEGFDFKAGQFVNVEVEENFWRSYSIASPASEKNSLEFVVDVSPGGKGSEFFKKIKANDLMHIKGPFGRLTLPESKDNDFCFVATGTGIAPFRSMVKELDGQRVSLFWGLRFKEDIFFEDEFKNLKKFCISLSKPLEWKGETGHVTECLKRDDFDKNTLFYLCGNQSMIEEVKGILIGKEVGEEKIIFEKFF